MQCQTGVGETAFSKSCSTAAVEWEVEDTNGYESGEDSDLASVVLASAYNEMSTVHTIHPFKLAQIQCTPFHSCVTQSIFTFTADHQRNMEQCKSNDRQSPPSFVHGVTHHRVANLIRH